MYVDTLKTKRRPKKPSKKPLGGWQKALRRITVRESDPARLKPPPVVSSDGKRIDVQ